MNGFGALTFSDGNRYEGQFVNDKREGLGKYFWRDGRVYDGHWKDGKQHGRGTYFKDGEEKIGEWDISTTNSLYIKF